MVQKYCRKIQASA